MQTAPGASQKKGQDMSTNVSGPDFDLEVRACGEKIFSALEVEGQSIFNRDWWYGKIMDWSMRDEHFKTQMFRFVDVLPNLTDSSDVTRHLKEYFRDAEGQLAGLFSFGLGIGSFAPGLLAATVKKNVTQMAKMFITGESPKEALPALAKARKNGIAFTADLLGEATLSESEAQEYNERYVELIDALAQAAPSWPDHPILDHDDQGPIPKVNVSVKLSSLYSQIKVAAWDETTTALKDRLRPLFKRAMDKNVFINVDMEQYALKDLTLQVFSELVLEPELSRYPHFGIVIQAYLRDSLTDTEHLVEVARRRGTPFSVRLVKGAYWDYETIHAHQQGWAIPVYTNKKESDWNFEQCAKIILTAHPHLKLAAGTHNVRSMAAVMVTAQKLGLPKRAYEIQMLFGMADAIKAALVKDGVRVREYATIGDLIPGMAYLVRRLLENTSNESFLRSKFADNVSTDSLLRNPGDSLSPSSNQHLDTEGVFRNEPLWDFAVEKNRAEITGALKKLRETLQKGPILVRPTVDGRPVDAPKDADYHVRDNPSRPTEKIAKVQMASPIDCEAAVKSAAAAFSTWSKSEVKDRTQVLRKLAQLFRRDRASLIATEILETGKPWSEADGDIAEAIDFCEYYAGEMDRLGRPDRVSFVQGESSFYHYQGRGVCLVIAPWNFPLAILCGMAVGALVTGNTVLLKPAEQSSLIAERLYKLLLEAGAPANTVQFLPGRGEVVGRHLVAHKDVSLISFTGSKSVGLEIIKQSAVVLPGQKFVKRCLIEMGGKNAIIVDSDADLDEAVAGVLYSAFGYAGQKCSAASRVIVLQEVFDRFAARLKEAVKSLRVLPAEDPRAALGPVIDREAYDRITKTVERFKSAHKVLVETDAPAAADSATANGYFVPPTVFADVPWDSELAQEEIFGPVVAMIRAKDLDDALRIANSTAYALTGGVFSRSPANIEKVKTHFECGNLYVNRGITGAMVGRHPFGGHKLSGLGSKTGGKDYLIQHMEPRVVTENTLRRGFAPAEEAGPAAKT
jgi:RHH-type transcriptional regulator, proline utilization regulon repressor / proline dehydrogenase / delta 1-pyrroline-5-carboxylate dehydrogenase